MASAVHVICRRFLPHPLPMLRRPPLSHGISSFVLKIVKEALLVVDDKQILVANTAFEELCDYTAVQLDENNDLLFSTSEKTAFFSLVHEHLQGTSVFNEAVVEAHNKSTGIFLSTVVFHPFLDELDNGKPKCMCVFRDPLFFKPLFANTATLMGLMEYLDEENDCVLRRANDATVRVLLRQEPSPIVLRANSSTSPIPAASSTGAVSLDKRLAHDIGFIFDEDDFVFFSECRSAATLHVRRYQVHRPQSLDPPLYIATTIAYLGRSLKGLSLFTFVAEDVTQFTSLTTQMEDSRRFIDSQAAFFARMVHELRSPLSGLLGMTGLLRNTIITSEQSDFIKTIEACGDSLLSLVGNILDLSNLERNNVTLAQQPFDIVDCIEEALDISSPQAAAKEIELLYELTPQNLKTMVVGDMIRVRQTLLNLLSNAVKFTNDHGHVTVRARIMQDESSANLNVTFEVEDDGIGIPEMSKPHLFKAFSQANRAINQHYGGSGLGLAIVKNLVELMHGTVRVDSIEGKGSIFYVTLMLHVAPRAKIIRDERLHEALASRTGSVILSDAKLAANLRTRLEALGLRSVSSGESGAAQIIFRDQLQMNTDTTSVVVTVGWKRSPGFIGEFLRKPIRNKHLLEVLCKAFGIVMSERGSRVVDGTTTTATTTTTTKRPRVQHTTLYLKILIVDDNVVNRKVTKKMLEACGCASSSIYTAGNGLEALTTIQQQPIDIILMDLEMPVMGGLEATREIHKHMAEKGQQRRPFIIAVTGAATEECRIACQEAGMNLFLVKPVGLNALLEAIEKANRSCVTVPPP